MIENWPFSFLPFVDLPPSFSSPLFDDSVRHFERYMTSKSPALRVPLVQYCGCELSLFGSLSRQSGLPIRIPHSHCCIPREHIDIGTLLRCIVRSEGWVAVLHALLNLSLIHI